MNKFTRTRVLVIVLMVALFVGVVPFTPIGERAYAGEWWPGFDFSTDEHYNDNYEGDYDEDDEDADSNVRINPLYEEVIDEEDIENYEDGIVFDVIIFRPSFISVMTMSTDGTGTYADTISEAGAVLRSGMTKREASPVVYYKMDCTFDRDEIIAAVDDIFSCAVMHTGNPKEGDYLNFLWKSWGSNISAMTDGEALYLQIKYNVKYYTTSSQETALDSQIDSLKSELNINNKSDYAKVKEIYNYICKNISYDYENLYDDSYYLKYTPYAALTNKTCVCQGYATLFYRLALEYGIDARVIAGTADGKNHAWNIVELDEKYYYLDATWDAGKSTYAYFLKGSKNWTSHAAASRYETGSFKAKYPISSGDYVSGGISAPKIAVNCVASSGKPKITWNAVEGADRYEVWRKVGANGSYSKLITTTYTYVTNTSATPGTTYYYKVRAICDKNSEGNSAYSEVVSCICALSQPTSVQVSNVEATGKPKVTWNAVEGADRYEVWRKVGANGSYSKLITTTYTYVTNTSATAGNTYYYKVRAICSANSGGNSAYSNEVSITSK